MSKVGDRSLEMLIWHFSMDPDIYNYAGKLPKQHFNVWLFSNPGEKILILVEILWSQDLRVEHLQCPNLFILRAERLFSRLPLVWQRMPSTPHFSNPFNSSWETKDLGCGVLGIWCHTGGSLRRVLPEIGCTINLFVHLVTKDKPYSIQLQFGLWVNML